MLFAKVLHHLCVHAGFALCFGVDLLFFDVVHSFRDQSTRPDARGREDYNGRWRPLQPPGKVSPMCKVTCRDCYIFIGEVTVV